MTDSDGRPAANFRSTSMEGVRKVKHHATDGCARSDTGLQVTRLLTRAPLVVLAAMAAPGPATAQPVWQVSEAPPVSIGDAPGERQDLFRIDDATVAPDGRVVLLDGGDLEIRVYSARGEFLSAIGRKGAGPGEFMGPTTMRVTEDGRLLVYDRVARRLTTFGPDEEVEVTRPIRYAAGARTPFRSSFRPFADGTLPLPWLAVSALDRYRRPDGLHEDDIEVHVHDGDGMRRILRRPRGPAYSVPGLLLPVPFEERTLIASGPRTVVVGTSHDRSFQRFDPTGRLVGEYTASGSTRRVTARDERLYEERLREERGDPISIPGVGTPPDAGSKVEAFIEEAPRGERMPLFDELLLDDEGRLWAREYSLAGDMVTWQAVAPDVGTVGRVELPRAWEVLEFGEDYVLVLERDEFDVEIVRLYRIER